MNRVEKQLLPVGGEKQAVNGTQRGEGSNGERALTVLTHVVDRQDRRPASGAGAVEGGVDDAVRGLDAVLLEGETLISHPRHKMHICPPVWQKHADDMNENRRKLMAYGKHTHLPLIQEYPGSQLRILEQTSTVFKYVWLLFMGLFSSSGLITCVR